MVISLFSFEGRNLGKEVGNSFAENPDGLKPQKLNCEVFFQIWKKTSKKSGDYSEEVTPVPIPNTEVKLLSADDTWREAAWESRSSPVYMAPWSSGQDTALSRR